MSGFFFAFLATLLASLGARDQLLVAQMTARQGARPLLLGTAFAATMASCAAAAWLAGFMAQELPGTPSRVVFAGIALVLAGGEAVLLGAKPSPKEPTNSLFAAFAVILAAQITDAVRFLILALAVLTAAPVPAAMGGMAGGALALGLAWMEPRIALRAEIGRLRRIAGLFLLLAGAVLIWRAI